MNKLITITLTVLTLSFLCSCKDGSVKVSLDGGDTIRLKYAQRLNIVKHDSFTIVTLVDPWNKGKNLHTYILAESDNKYKIETAKNLASELASTNNIANVTLVPVPLKRAVITTSPHCGLLMSLGRGENICGVCDLNYINLPWIKQRHNDGFIADCGNGITPTLEKIIDINADAIMISPFQNSGGYGRLEEWGKPIIETADYMETSALGRAEWMKFYGMLFDAEKQADSLFAVVENNYNSLKEIARKSEKRNSIIIDKMNGAVWYVPGGNSTIGRTIADANAGYAFADNKDSGSLPQTFETVLTKAGDADVWMFRHNSKNAATYSALLAENQGYSLFKAFKNKQVYGCHTTGSTFYEDTPFHPDLLLRDLIIITHPDLKHLGEPRYFIPLK